MSTYKKTGWIRNTSEGIKDEIEGIIYEPSKKLTGDAKSIKKNYGKEMDQLYSLKEIKDCKKELATI